MAKKPVALTAKFTTEVTSKAPFSFDATVHKPSHLSARVKDYREGIYWQTTRFNCKIIRLRMENSGTNDNPAIRLTIFTQMTRQ